jgi:hypothetical protein
MRLVIGHPATGIVLVLILAGAGYLGFAKNTYVGLALWAVAAVVVVVYIIGWLYDRNRRSRPVAEKSNNSKKSTKIQTGDINAPTTFGKKSPITIIHGRPQRTFRGKLDLSEVAKFKGARVGFMADGGQDEPSAFAAEIEQLLRSVGWEIAYSTPANIGSTSSLPRGVVELGSWGEFPPEMEALERTLNSAGCPTMRSFEGKVSVDQCPWVFVWRMP